LKQEQKIKRQQTRPALFVDLTFSLDDYLATIVQSGPW
jgi:hypothetical protein